MQDTLPKLLRIPALDGLRGFAILWVILHNSSLIELQHVDHLLAHPSAWMSHVYDHFTQMGWLGVQLFFVLSGFLITRILLRTKGSAHYLRNFFNRRMLRIFPVYFLTLVAVLVVLANLPFAPNALRDTSDHQPALWVFLCNWVQPFGIAVFGLTHFWSLAVEEQFYLVWPFVVRAHNARALLVLSAVLIVIALLSRLLLVHFSANREVTYQFTITRMDALLSGAIVAIVCMNDGLRAVADRWMRYLLPGSAVFFLVGLIVTQGYQLTAQTTQTVSYTLLSLAFALLIARLALGSHRPLPLWLQPLESRWLISCGKFSYAMYVVHYPLDRYVGEPMMQQIYGTHPPLVADVLYGFVLIAISYALGIVSYHAIERRFLALGYPHASEQRLTAR